MSRGVWLPQESDESKNIWTGFPPFCPEEKCRLRAFLCFCVCRTRRVRRGGVRPSPPTFQSHNTCFWWLFRGLLLAGPVSDCRISERERDEIVSGSNPSSDIGVGRSAAAQLSASRRTCCSRSVEKSLAPSVRFTAGPPAAERNAGLHPTPALDTRRQLDRRSNHIPETFHSFLQ